MKYIIHQSIAGYLVFVALISGMIITAPFIDDKLFIWTAVAVISSVVPLSIIIWGLLEDKD